MYSFRILMQSFCSLCENFKDTATKLIVKNYSPKVKDAFCLGPSISSAMEQTSIELVWTQGLYYIAGRMDFWQDLMARFSEIGAKFNWSTWGGIRGRAGESMDCKAMLAALIDAKKT